MLSAKRILGKYYRRPLAPGIVPRARRFRRPFSSSSARWNATDTPPKQPRESLFRRLASAWKNTPIKWSPLPFGVGALLLVALQARRDWLSADYKKREPHVEIDDDGHEVVRLKGAWQVHILGALPLRNMSRLWGYLNELELPIWARPVGFRLYSRIFGVTIEEAEHDDLTVYKSLGDFFYRRLKPGLRPAADAALISPADGTVLHFGAIQDFRVEQVKGITYSLDALLGSDSPPTPPGTPASEPEQIAFAPRELGLVADREFANVNGIAYTLDQLLGTAASGASTPTQPDPADPAAPPARHGAAVDASVGTEAPLPDALAHDASVAAQLGVRPALARGRSWNGAGELRPGHGLFFCVIYLAPGDYHRFHSPTAWVVERRRHFVGELFSVSPFIARRIENLFVLNERVALLGRWRHGFFGMVPVGATNVGSIKVNFDQQLRTNLRGKRPPPGTYAEAVYSAASPVLNGQPLLPAEEMGGFRLGSTVVLVFEAPKDFNFAIQPGQKVKVGQKLGDLAA